MLPDNWEECYSRCTCLVLLTRNHIKILLSSILSPSREIYCIRKAFESDTENCQLEEDVYDIEVIR